MVVTPKQAREYRSKEDNASIKNLEREIDAALLEGRFTFDLKSFTNRRVVDAIIRTYREAGWKVKYESDQRDGDYLDFRGGSARK